MKKAYVFEKTIVSLQSKTWKDLIDCNHEKKMLKQCFFSSLFQSQTYRKLIILNKNLICYGLLFHIRISIRRPSR